MVDRGIVYRLTNLFVAVVFGLWVLWPVPLIFYMETTGTAAMVFQNVTIHSIITVMEVLLAGGAAVIGWRCYRHSREPALLPLILALILLAGAQTTHGVLAGLSVHAALVSRLAEVARATMELSILASLWVWHRPPRSSAIPSFSGNVLRPVAIMVALMLIAVGIAHIFPGLPFRAGHWVLSLTVSVAATMLVASIMPRNWGVRSIYAAALLFAQSSAAYLLSGDWTHLWWLAHLLALGGLLVLGLAMVIAYRTTRSLSSVLTEPEMLDLVRQSERAADIAQQANTAKSRFLAAASHDLRQPLVPIRLLSELLDEEVAGTNAHGLVVKLRSAVQSLDDLLSKLMDFSRIESGVIQPRFERVRLGPILERFHHEFEDVANQKGLQLRYSPCRISVWTDQVLLEQVLRNLIENAIKYTKTGGILIGCRYHRDTVQVCVVDTGIGIPPGQLRAVFTEFYQGEHPGGERHPGLGLGLASVDRLCRMLGHTVEVKSVPGRGSIFYIGIGRAWDDGEK